MRENYFKKYVDKNYIHRNEGYSKEEIEEKKSLYSLPFPQMYLDFLEIAGKEFNTHLEIGWGFENLEGNNNSLVESANSFSKELILDNSNIVFWSGELKDRFFNLKEGNNPPVYTYSMFQAEKLPKKITNSFTEFIDHIICERRFKNDMTFNPVLCENNDRKMGLKQFNEKNLPYLDQVQVVSSVLRKVDQLFKGEKADVVKMILLDLAKQKARFLYNRPDFFSELIDKSNGNFENISKYYILEMYDFEKPPRPILFKQAVFIDREPSLVFIEKIKYPPTFEEPDLLEEGKPTIAKEKYLPYAEEDDLPF